MTEIKLYNTASRSKEVFTPIDPENVRMYVCGPTVYDRAHLGNARPVLVFDVLYRLLRYVYGDDHVTYVRNFTDVDDKINATALARKEAGAEGSLEDLIGERAEETISWYLSDMGALGAMEPTHMPRATGFISQMITLTQHLIDDGFAYARDGHVLFRVRAYKEYGKLSGRSVDDMIAGARVEVAPYKEDPMDFVLWKPSDDELPGWDSPWGRGRPGWHIECSAMAADLLGDAFDIHGGGNDLTFPHHENEIAQSKCAGHGFANYWLHNEMLQVEGKKMSKSLGNFFTVRDLLDQDVPGEVIRFVMLSTHYRKPMDWTEKKRVEAEKTLRRWHSAATLATSLKPKEPVDYEPDFEFVRALQDDLNTSLALKRLHELANEILHSSASNGDHLKVGKFVCSANMLGLLEDTAAMGSWVFDGAVERLANQRLVRELETALGQARSEALETKDFSRVDQLKSAFVLAGLEVRMSKEGVELVMQPDFDPAKLEALK
ncbi:MAG: cysteine--tRNA ligase [Pseudomonadota bacterium]